MSSPEPSDRPPQGKNPAQKIGPKNVSVPLPARPAPATARVQPDDASFETDFADLAARFAAKSGGGLSPELSADLALEIVLNEIVEQACLATGATGAAIVLRRDSDMICRATSGATSPDLGSRLDMSGGLSGECVKTLRTVRSDDVFADQRADVEASRRLGVRSVMVMPLLRGAELVGAFEIFSSRVNAFGDRDERTLEALATRTLKNLARALQAMLPATAAVAATPAKSVSADSKPVGGSTVMTKAHTSTPATAGLPEKEDSERGTLDQESAIRNLVLAANRAASLEEPRSEESFATNMSGGGPPGGSWWKYDFNTMALTAAVVVCTLMLAFVVAKHVQLRQREARAHSAPKVAAAKATEFTPAASPASTLAAPKETASTGGSGELPTQQANGITIRPAGRGDASSVPPGGLRIYENGKEIFRLTAPPIPADGNLEDKRDNKRNVVQQATAIEREQIVQLSPEAADGSLLRRVEPQYPDQARAQKIQGSVVLDVHIRANGAVEGVQVVSGDPLLAQASTDAVKQWRYKPYLENGLPAQMETRVTLNFTLPQ
jgi:TonB family protein